MKWTSLISCSPPKNRQPTISKSNTLNNLPITSKPKHTPKYSTQNVTLPPLRLHEINIRIKKPTLPGTWVVIQKWEEQQNR